MPLTPTQNKRLVQLTFEALTLSELEMLLSMEMGLNWDELVFERDVPKVVIFHLCKALTMRGLIGDFIDVVIAARPRKQEIQTEFPEMLKALNFQPQSTAETTKELDKHLKEVQRLLDDPTVSVEAQKAKGLLTELADTIAQLQAYKDLHDKLHILQGDTGSLELAVANVTPGLADSVEIIRSTAEGCMPFVTRLPASAQFEETQWLDTLRHAALLLEEAFQHHTAAADDEGKAVARNTAADALVQVRSMLMTEPSRIDGLIRKTADKIKLEGLGGLFKAVAQVSSSQTEVQQGMASAEVNAGRVEGSLKSRVNRHVGWQEVMRDINLARETVASIVPIVVPPGADESQIFTDKDEPLATAKANFNGMWAVMVNQVNQLQSQAPDALRTKTVADAIASMAAAREREAWGKAAKAAAAFSQVCVEEFLVTDAELKLAAMEVAKVGNSITQILNKLETQ